MLTRTVAPASQPLDSTAAKLHLRESDTAQDALIANLITEAVEQVEAITGRALITQTWKLTASAFPSGAQALELPRPPVQSITSVQYYDTDGVLQTWSLSNYELIAESETAYIVPAYGVEWPQTRDHWNAVQVTFVCGYGNAAAVPQCVKNAMLMLIAHRYENREAAVDSRGAVAELPLGFEMALAPIRVHRF